MQTTINKALITLKKFNKKDTSFYCKELQQPTHHSKTKKELYLTLTREPDTTL